VARSHASELARRAKEESPIARLGSDTEEIARDGEGEGEGEGRERERERKCSVKVVLSYRAGSLGFRARPVPAQIGGRFSSVDDDFERNWLRAINLPAGCYFDSRG